MMTSVRRIKLTADITAMMVTGLNLQSFLPVRKVAILWAELDPGEKKTWRIGGKRHRKPQGHTNILNVISWWRLLKTVGWEERRQLR